jgi:hypothetical protein
MLLQDSFRPAGRILPAWKALRPTETPRIGFQGICGDFSTFVMDAYVPEATQVFYGAYYSTEEALLLKNWERVDSRIVVAAKPDMFLPWKSDQRDIWMAQWERWRRRHGEEQGPREESKILQPLIEELAVLCGARSSFLEKLSPRQFEELIAHLFQNHGFKVHLTAQTRDGGYDIVAVDHLKINGPFLVEVKHFAPHRPVNVGLVRALYGVKTLHRAAKAFLVTSSYVSRDAKREFARVIPWEIEFKERNEIIVWCQEYAASLLAEFPGKAAEPGAAPDG